ncbi:THAP domain-containing protein 2-like [Aphis gossypii]|uniref:THAP domain-containing protein 2-like n=1 Tax=Aphis gossypii TaxID=80765 RepID=UPI002158DBD1|nr:THAP domain-containing protein 2-like [Aphis gossypii]
MTTKSLKPKGGSCCAVATCINYAGKVKRDGNTNNISFYRFPKDPELQNKWALKCRRGDSMNPCLSYMCSEHFSDDAYVRDLKAELLAYTPKFCKLKPDALPTLNLPEDYTHSNVASTSSSSRRSRMELRKKKTGS